MARLIILYDQGVSDSFQVVVDSVVAYNQCKGKFYTSDIFLFEGGTDVDPRLYKEPLGKYSQTPDKIRDSFEHRCFLEAQQVGAACLGICRGAQFLTVMNGGELIQHVSGHGTNHRMDTADGHSMMITSTHHQMMAPMETDHDIVGWSSSNRSNIYLNGENKDASYKLDSDLGIEPEIVWYPLTRSLCIQGHPEYMRGDEEFPRYCRYLVHKYIFKKDMKL